MFDQKKYWLERHSALRGKHASVGLIGSDEEKQRKASELFQEDIRHVFSHIKRRHPGGKVLDIGCGIGRASTSIVPLGFDYLGVDLSPVAIEAAKEACPDAHFLSGDFLSLEFEEPFDVVMCAWVLVHFVDDEAWGGAVRRISECLGGKGLFILVDVMADGEEIHAKPHYKNRTIHKYKDELMGAGLEHRPEVEKDLKQGRQASACMKNLYIFEKL